MERKKDQFFGSLYLNKATKWEVQMEKRLVNFLLVEDNQDHAELVRLAFKVNNIGNSITHVENGEEALRYIKKQNEYTKAPTPDVVLLDLNLPGISGLEVLKRVKEDSSLSSIPVVVLTTSEAERDRAEAYEYRANSYLVKPLDFEQFRKLVSDLKIYWGIWNVGVGDLAK